MKATIRLKKPGDTPAGKAIIRMIKKPGNPRKTRGSRYVMKGRQDGTVML